MNLSAEQAAKAGNSNAVTIGDVRSHDNSLSVLMASPTFLATPVLTTAISPLDVSIAVWDVTQLAIQIFIGRSKNLVGCRGTFSNFTEAIIIAS